MIYTKRRAIYRERQSIYIEFVLVRRDGRKEGVEQVLPVGLQSEEDSEAEAAKEPADEGVDDASHEHSLRHLQQLHLQRYQVQLPQGRSHLRDTYLGIEIFRFYFKCIKCSAELTIKTDPQNSDYVVESGASRNFEPWRAKDEEVDKEKQKRDTEEMGDAMKSLANRTLDSKREMDILAALDEVKSMRSRQATISVDAMLEILQRSAEEKEKKLEEEDEALIKSLFGAPREVVRRIDDDILDDDEDLSQISTDNTKTSNNNSKVGERFLKNFPLMAPFGRAVGKAVEISRTVQQTGRPGGQSVGHPTGQPASPVPASSKLETMGWLPLTNLLQKVYPRLVYLFYLHLRPTEEAIGENNLTSYVKSEVITLNPHTLAEIIGVQLGDLQSHFQSEADLVNMVGDVSEVYTTICENRFTGTNLQARHLKPHLRILHRWIVENVTAKKGHFDTIYATYY
ncbi:unnamed protein product [Camellia sinensis]